MSFLKKIFQLNLLFSFLFLIRSYQLEDVHFLISAKLNGTSPAIQLNTLKSNRIYIYFLFDFGYLLPITSGCYCKKCFDKYLSGDRVIDEHDKVIQDDIANDFFKYHIDKIAEVDKEHPDLRLCPKCDGLYTGYPAISRRDNKTEICTACGISEALEDAYNNMGEEE